MRLRVLELPTQPDVLVESFRIPFVLVLDDVDLPPKADEAEQWVNAARGVGAEGLLVFREELEIEQSRVPGDEWPHYTSTYCIHDRHGDCRVACKVCRAPCRCSCHDTDPIDTPDGPVARAELEENPA